MLLVNGIGRTFRVLGFRWRLPVLLYRRFLWLDGRGRDRDRVQLFNHLRGLHRLNWFLCLLVNQRLRLILNRGFIFHQIGLQRLQVL